MDTFPNSFLASALALSIASASGQVLFHTDFDEADLASISGLTIDTPNTDLATTDSGTVTLNTVDQTLEMASNGANLWSSREGAPIAWMASPIVAVGETWYVETSITHEDSTGANSEYDQAGITFYSGTAGANPGSENTGTFQSLFVGINDWNAWTHRIQGLADNDPNIGEPATVGDDTFEYRAEITEGGTLDIYNFFYREDPADDWTQFGPIDLEQDFDNTAVGLYTKSHNNNTTSTTAFGSFTIGLVPAPSSSPVLSIAQSGGDLSFSWNSTSGQLYDLLSSTDLSTDPTTWAPFNDGVTTHENIAASGTGITALSAIPVTDPKRFFVILEKN